jgi:thiamine phosphate synthase YjbQ (UPF0047 family)
MAGDERQVMKIINQTIEILTESGIGIYNITPQIVQLLDTSAVKNGQVIVFSRHTTTALAINENEERLLADIKVYRRTDQRSLSPDGHDAQYQRNNSSG